MKRIIAILLLVIGLGLGYLGFNKMDNSGSSIEIGNLELSAEDAGSKSQAYVLFGAATLCLVLGAGTLMKSK